MKLRVKTLRLLALVCTVIALVNYFTGCRKKKSDQEQILDTLNGYFSAHASGEYEKSYEYLAPQTKKLTSKKEWVANQLKTINSVRLMRDPRLENLVVKADTATGDFRYRGIPSQTLMNVMAQLYLKNILLPEPEIKRSTEEYLNEHFDELSSPQSLVLSFIRTPSGWKILLDAKGKPYALSEARKNEP